MSISRNISRRFPRLTEREISVALAISDGLSNTAIAARLGITEKTVKNVSGSVSLKMDIETGGSVRVRVALCVHEVGPYAPKA